MILDKFADQLLHEFPAAFNNTSAIGAALYKLAWQYT
jgi:hypothetical protein